MKEVTLNNPHGFRRLCCPHKDQFPLGIYQPFFASFLQAVLRDIIIVVCIIVGRVRHAWRLLGAKYELANGFDGTQIKLCA